MSIRNSGLSSDFQNYNPVNIVAYLGCCLRNDCLQVLKGSRLTQKILGFVGLTLFCSVVVYVSLRGHSSRSSFSIATSYSYGSRVCWLLAIATLLTQPMKLRIFFTPCVALGLCSALVYVLERVVGAAMRTEAAKHLEPI